MPVWSGETIQARNPHQAWILTTDNVEIAIVGPDLEEHVLWAIPPIDHFLDHILVIVQLKAKGSLVCFATGITLNVQPHGHIFAHTCKRWPSALVYSIGQLWPLLRKVSRRPKEGFR